MKKILIILSLIAIGMTLLAQDVTEGTKTMSEGSFNAFSVELPSVSEKEAIEGWEKFIEEYSAKVKKDKKAKLYLSENVQIPSLSANPIDTMRYSYLKKPFYLVRFIGMVIRNWLIL